MDMFSYLLGRSSGGGGTGGLKVEVVQELPETGQANVLYLVPRQVSKYRNVFDEYLWINETWEMVGTTDIDISGKQDKMQFATMPTANADNLGKIYQYIGTTNANYTNGYFYICVSDGEATPTYSWVNLQVQDGSSGDYDIVILNAYVGSTFSQDLKQAELDKASEYITQMYRDFNNKTNGIKPKVLIVYNHNNFYAAGNIYFNTAITTKAASYRFSNNSNILQYGETENFNITNSVTFQGTWDGDNFICSSFSLSNWNQRRFLGTGGNAAFEPTLDYEPSTKLYADKISYKSNDITVYTNQSYQVGDKVYYPLTRKFYNCIQNASSSIKPTSAAYWEEITLTNKQLTLANQKYVDDSIASAITNALGGNY